MIARIKKMGVMALFGIAMFSAGGIYVAFLMIFPQVAMAVLGK